MTKLADFLFPGLSAEAAVALVSAIVAICAVFVSIILFFLQRRREKTNAILSLHQLWWGERYDNARSMTFEFVEEFRKCDFKTTDLIKSYKLDDGKYRKEKRQVGLIAFFFADVNALIDLGLVSERAALRFFGPGQFAWFSKFLLAIANEIEANRKLDDGQEIRWICEVRALDRRFKKFTN